MFNCFPNADARAQTRVGPGLVTPLQVTQFIVARSSYRPTSIPHCHVEKCSYRTVISGSLVWSLQEVS